MPRERTYIVATTAYFLNMKNRPPLITCLVLIGLSVVCEDIGTAIQPGEVDPLTFTHFIFILILNTIEGMSKHEITEPNYTAPGCL
ncbi:hypothetical protein D3C85_1547740 [compost metagenome]